jgi:competence ComEA-like helix-hairpin-helix protein
MRGVTFFILMIFLLSNISASCNESQIDINTATLEELDKLTGIGPVYAQRIIDSRSFSSLDELLKVKGIGNVTLEKIKSQGLACVGEKISTDEENSTPETQKQEVSNNTSNNETVNIPAENELFKGNEPSLENSPKNFSMPKITMNSQSIKTIENEQKNSKVNPAVYELGGFCILLIALFAIKKLRKNKNEFRK